MLLCIINYEFVTEKQELSSLKTLKPEYVEKFTIKAVKN